MSHSSPSTPNGRLPYKLPLVMKEEGGDRWIEDADGVPIPPDQLIEAINLCAQSEKRATPEISAGGAHDWKLFGTPGITGTVAGLTVHMDPAVPDNTVIVRDELGRELGRIINVG